MRRFLVAGNWKMNGSREGAMHLVNGILQGLRVVDGTEVVLCPPFVYLVELAKMVAGHEIRLGAQDLCAESDGAYTGEVSGAMLRDVGCSYVIVGHSERREWYGEQDTLVARKFVMAQKAGLTPILCVGETLSERERGETDSVVTRQLTAVLDLAGVSAFDQAVVAYEPIWAIGTGKTATPEQAEAVHALMRACIRARDARIGDDIRLLYGGSVKASNAAQIFGMPDIDGGLVGAASLDAGAFLAICKAAA